MPEDCTPSTNSEYGKTEYWDNRFDKEEAYEWLGGYERFKHLIKPHLKSTDKILVIGAGNSSLPLDLYKDGINHIVALDISSVLVSKMTKRLSEAKIDSIRYQQGDMLDLPHKDGEFDCVIEKATLDVLFVENDSPWEPLPRVQSDMHTTLHGIHRVLKPDGVFISVTFAQPHFRKRFLRDGRYSWGCSVETYGGGEGGSSFEYFVYVMKKGAREELDEGGGDGLAVERGVDVDYVQEHVETEDFLTHMEL
ncbi:hypothetical protein BSKO_09492 [Bryopsis sp. KO-2023]|nr:hypothetical protein BSKO_09492 [Bryopsis sp. KO-2023]